MLYAQYVKEQIWKTVPENKVGGHWRTGDRGYPHICKKLEDNFLEMKPTMANLKGTLFAQPIKYHRDACSLNSSQVMCINFFWKFFQKEGYEEVLLSALRKCGLDISADTQITNAIVEYEPDSKEGTNFDFYMILSNGQHISMEIKYTEAEFGGISRYTSGDPTKYGKKWETVYSSIVAQSPYLHNGGTCKNGYPCLFYGCTNPGQCKESDNCGIFRFFIDYQINRNIALASQGSYVLFLTPKANVTLNSGREYIESLENSYIRNLYWEDIVEAVLAQASAYPELQQYYTSFKNKYIDFVPWQLTI